LKHEKYNSAVFDFILTGGNSTLSNVARSKNQFKYNGQEFQDELELNMTAMDFRQYDNALGRFHGVDLLAELDYSGSPYSFGFNNPVYFSDPSGLTPQGGDQQPQSGCPCDGTCVCLSTVDIQGWVRPTSASYTIFQSADNRSVAVNIQPSYGSQERRGGGGVN
jgi:RHS repeat-associated protein